VRTPPPSQRGRKEAVAGLAFAPRFGAVRWPRRESPGAGARAAGPRASGSAVPRPPVHRRPHRRGPHGDTGCCRHRVGGGARCTVMTVRIPKAEPFGCCCHARTLRAGVGGRRRVPAIRVPSARGVTDAMGRPQYCALGPGARRRQNGGRGMQA